jgi:predicted HTH transcriptional regulator
MKTEGFGIAEIVMLTKDELIQLLTDLESHRIERTTAIKDTDKFSKAVCAFANDIHDSRKPGYLLIGVNDTGVPSGLTVTDGLLLSLGALRSDGNIQPLPGLTVEKFSLPGGEAAVVEVLPSDMPPVRYWGQVWIRIGAYIQYLKLPGNTLTNLPEDQAEISGDISSIIREMEFRIRSGIQTSLTKRSDFQEKMVSDYPIIALRELLLNAVVHRDYQSNTPVRFYWFADRIEIQSPGGLYGEVTQDTLTRRSSYRNPVIAEALKALGYINRFGYGIQRSESELSDNGSPPLKFEIDGRSFLVTIWRKIL